MKYLIAFCSRQETASDVISGRFMGLGVPLEGAFSTFFRYNFRPEVDNDVISGMVIDPGGMKAGVKFSDFRSNLKYLKNDGLRCDRGVGDGLVTPSASRFKALHDKPQPRTQRGKGKKDDRETRGAAIWKQMSTKLDTAGES